MGTIDVTTTLQITYGAILTDTYHDMDDLQMTDEEIDESIEQHIKEWCLIHDIDRDAVTIVNKEIDRR